jgi:hypothetical protein
MQGEGSRLSNDGDSVLSERRRYLTLVGSWSELRGPLPGYPLARWFR